MSHLPYVDSECLPQSLFLRSRKNLAIVPATGMATRGENELDGHGNCTGSSVDEGVREISSPSECTDISSMVSSMVSVFSKGQRGVEDESYASDDSDDNAEIVERLSHCVSHVSLDEEFRDITLDASAAPISGHAAHSPGEDFVHISVDPELQHRKRKSGHMTGGTGSNTINSLDGYKYSEGKCLKWPKLRASTKRPRSIKMGIDRYSCPFVKHDRVRYEDVHNVCTAPPGFEWGRLTEHIARCHSAEKRCIYCLKTWNQKEDWEGQLRRHIISGQCIPQIERLCRPECMTAAQEQQYRQESHERLSADEKWIALFMRLFPGEYPLPSPRYDFLVPRHQFEASEKHRHPQQSRLALPEPEYTYGNHCFTFPDIPGPTGYWTNAENAAQDFEDPSRENTDYELIFR